MQSIPVLIHQPSIKQISMFGEDKFFSYAFFLIKPASFLQDKKLAQGVSPFNIFMNILGVKELEEYFDTFTQFMLLFFRTYKVTLLLPRSIVIFDINNKQNFVIDENNFEEFVKIISDIIYLSYFDNNKSGSSQQYNPVGMMSQKLAEKFYSYRKKLQEKKDQKDKKQESLLSQYLTILSIGIHIDINTLAEYSIYQLLNSVERLQKKITYDMNLQARMAGAKDPPDVEHWFN